jgi:hypothetical protein
MWRARNCSTVAGTLNEIALFTKNNRAMDAFALDAIQSVLPQLRANDQLPLILHVFSNGGAMSVERLEKLLFLSLSAHGMDPELRMFQQRLKLGAEIFDSGPVLMTLEIGVRAIRSAVQNYFLFLSAVVIVVILYFYDKFVSWAFGRPDMLNTYWNHLKSSTACMRQAYVYSTADTITPHLPIEEMIEARRKLGVDVTTLLFDDSPHVQHLRFHPAEYGQLMDVILLKVEKYMK